MDDPPKQPRTSWLQRNQRTGFSRARIISVLVLFSILLLLFSSLVLLSLPQATNKNVKDAQAHQTAQHTHTLTATATDDRDKDVTPTPTPPIFTPRNTLIPPLQLPANYYVIYEQQNKLHVVSTNDNSPQNIATSGYSYSEAVRPIVTPSGQILYSGDGLWLTDIFGGTPTRIADLPTGQVITSLAMSSDGTMIAWSTEPTNGKGIIDIYAGPLDSPALIYEQQTLQCPCFRVFSYMNGPGSQGDTTVLLTDDQGSHEAVQFGLWSLDLTKLPATPEPAQSLQSTPSVTPQTIVDPPPNFIMDEDPQQGPLALAPSGNILLYSSSEGSIPIPTDLSVPEDIGALSYANSLDVTILKGPQLTMSTSQVILPEQHNLNNTSDYHWVTTPVFSPDGHTLVYVEFTSDSQDPFDRHSAIFTVQVTGSGAHLHVSKPQLLATTTAKLLELGSWLNNTILTFYGDNNLYALDVKSGAVTTLAQTGMYARIIAVMHN